ncbi:hypothetical protein BaRGS_00023930 [Batillaria attramentaria]|uniref:Uncharacterized protein n=1 Tax=Batillaria attramentaria TaxID=370345 RepID=A0ABD0KCU8_9CAEN
MVNARLNQCLCEHCENVSLNTKSIDRIATQHTRIRHENHAVALTTCENGGKSGAYCKCPDCDIDMLQTYLSPLENHRGQLSWHRWTSKKVTA